MWLSWIGWLVLMWLSWIGWLDGVVGADFGGAQMKKDVSGDTSSFQLVSQVLIRQP